MLSRLQVSLFVAATLFTLPMSASETTSNSSGDDAPRPTKRNKRSPNPAQPAHPSPSLLSTATSYLSSAAETVAVGALIAASGTAEERSAVWHEWRAGDAVPEGEDEVHLVPGWAVATPRPGDAGSFDLRVQVLGVAAEFGLPAQATRTQRALVGIAKRTSCV